MPLTPPNASPPSHAATPVLTDDDLDRITDDQRKLALLASLLDEAYEHNHAHPDNQYYKSSEGYLEVHYGTTWDRAGKPQLTITEVDIFSYTFSGLSDGGRHHRFGSVDEALEAVREMHAEEMATDWDEHYATMWDEDLEER